jgi:hypothetical protein
MKLLIDMGNIITIKPDYIKDDYNPRKFVCDTPISPMEKPTAVVYFFNLNFEFRDICTILDLQ